MLPVSLSPLPSYRGRILSVYVFQVVFSREIPGQHLPFFNSVAAVKAFFPPSPSCLGFSPLRDPPFQDFFPSPCSPPDLPSSGEDSTGDYFPLFFIRPGPQYSEP